jgi:hypothetical protein
MRQVQKTLLASIDSAFPSGLERCLMTLKQGDEVDTTYAISTIDCIKPADWHSIPDTELENFHWGLTYLDPSSFRFYLPAFLAYSIRHVSSGGSLVVNACIQNLRPPDHVPPRLKSLALAQRKAAVAALEFLAFDPDSQFQDVACQTLEEYWIDNPLYKDT